MAYATHNRSALNGLHLEISAGLYRLMTRIMDFRAYRRTVRELSALSDRDLTDLGLTRYGIHAAAHAAVYGTNG